MPSEEHDGPVPMTMPTEKIKVTILDSIGATLGHCNVTAKQ